MRETHSPSSMFGDTARSSESWAHMKYFYCVMSSLSVLNRLELSKTIKLKCRIIIGLLYIHRLLSNIFILVEIASEKNLFSRWLQLRTSAWGLYRHQFFCLQWNFYNFYIQTCRVSLSLPFFHIIDAKFVFECNTHISTVLLLIPWLIHPSNLYNLLGVWQNICPLILGKIFSRPKFFLFYTCF